MGLSEAMREIIANKGGQLDTEFEDGVQSFLLEDLNENSITVSVDQVEEIFSFYGTSSFDVEIISEILKLLLNTYGYRFVDQV